MLRGGFLALAFLGCSASGETGATIAPNPGGTGGSEAGAPGDGGMGPIAGTGGTSEAGTAGTGGTPDLCQAGDERLCSCAPGYGGKQTCSDFGWNICRCPDWQPAGAGGSGAGGAGGSGGTEPWLGRDCETGTDQCRVGPPELPIGKAPLCMQASGVPGGGSGQPGYCSFACSATDNAQACVDLGGTCMPAGDLISHCVGGD